MELGTNYALTRVTSVAEFVVAAMSPDGKYILYYVNNSVSPRLYLWDSQLAANIYSSNLVTTSSQLAVSRNGQRLAFWASPGSASSLTAIDRNTNSSILVATGTYGSKTRLQFSSDSRFLLYSTRSAGVLTDTNKVEDVYLYDFETNNRILVSRRANSVTSPNGTF